MAWKIAAVLVALALGGCGDLKRDNPLDPKAEIFIGDLSTALVGLWSLENDVENQVYEFKADGRVELLDFSSPGGGDVDRNASHPQTLVIRFSGTYTLGGNLLRISFTNGISNDPGSDPPSLPPAGKVNEISITRNTLNMKDSTGERKYTRI